MTEKKYSSRRFVLKSAAAGVAIAGIGAPTATAQGRQTETLTTEEGWITATVNAGQRTVISVELDESVYGRWPDNPTEYVMEANVGVVVPDTGVSDDFRIGWGGADTVQRDGTAGGYIRRNPGPDEDRFDTLEEDVQGLFQATESSDQQSYEFVINWQTPIPEKPDRIQEIRVNEVFGLDGGGGVQTEGIDVSTGSSGVLGLAPPRGGGN